jgi:hypothetical protein
VLDPRPPAEPLLAVFLNDFDYFDVLGADIDADEPLGDARRN